MSETISAHFDGKVIVPDTPLELPAGLRLRVRIEMVEPEAYPLAEIGQLATDMGLTDLADRHQDYAHPERKDSAGG
jgi:hypothetical protein